MKSDTQKKQYIWYYLMGVLVCKIITMVCFSSDYQDAMFYPFASRFVDGLGSNRWNPYEYYYQNGMVPSFPYPPMMLFLQSIPVILIRVCSVQNAFIIRAIFKLPILIADCALAWLLSKIYTQKLKYIAIIYFTSPIIMYACYMHGQLDVIPTAFLFGSIYILLLQKRGFQWKAGIALALTVLTKQHTLAVVPILIFFMEKRHGLQKSMQMVTAFIAVSVSGILPFLSEGFIRQVIYNKEQGQLLEVFINYGTIQLMLPILFVLILYLKAFYLDKINPDLLISYCGILFAVFLALVPPMPGWYVWIVPFITIFFIKFGKDKYKNVLLFLLLNGSYLIYFLFFHKTDMTDLYFMQSNLNGWKINSPNLKNIVFTVMTGLLLYTIYQMYQIGIVSNSLYRRGNVPFSIGIAGDSGSGKTCMLEMIKSILGNKNILEIEGDGDHKWERGEREWLNYTHLDPKANYLYRQARDIQMLKAGKSVFRVEYDHGSGKFSTPQKYIPKRYIVVCGLHSLYLPQMRRQMDLTIFMDTDEQLRRYWKIRRDIAARGYDSSRIEQQIEARQKDAQKYILPQKQYADLTIKYTAPMLGEDYLCECNPDIDMKITVSADLNLDSITETMQESGVKVTYDYSEDLNWQTVAIDGKSLEQAKLDINELAERTIPQLEEITRQRLSINMQDGVKELFLLLVISEKMRGNL